MIEGIEDGLKPGGAFWWCINCKVQTVKTSTCPKCGKAMPKFEVTNEKVPVERGTGYRVKHAEEPIYD